MALIALAANGETTGLATYPAGFGHVMYTCTGSEAVDLAIRIARHETGGTGVVITANAYHGTTGVTAGLSPLLGPSVPLGRDVWTVAPPDPAWGGTAEVGAAMASDVRAAFADMRRHGVRPAAFLADSIFSTDGTIPDPAGFLAPVAEAVRAEGALYIADEVQPGFERTGRHMWGFQRHGIAPDMAVMGKAQEVTLSRVAVFIAKAQFRDRLSGRQAKMVGRIIQRFSGLPQGKPEKRWKFP